MERPETHSEIDGFICIWVKILGLCQQAAIVTCDHGPAEGNLYQAEIQGR